MTLEESVASEMLLMSVSAWLLLGSGGASAVLAVGLGSPWSSSMWVQVRQVSAVCVCHFTRKQ